MRGKRGEGERRVRTRPSLLEKRKIRDAEAKGEKLANLSVGVRFGKTPPRNTGVLLQRR